MEKLEIIWIVAAWANSVVGAFLQLPHQTLGNKMICLDCVTPQPLKRLFDQHGKTGSCKYCGKDGRAIEAQTLFGYVYKRVEENVAAESDLSGYEHGLLYECGADDIAVQTIDIVLMEWFELEEEPYFDDLCNGVPPAFKINEAGDETHFYSDEGLLERNFYEDKWARFIDNISYSHRFFNPTASEFLDSVFSFLSDEAGALKTECLRVIGNGELLFRARNAQNYEKAKEIITNPSGQFGPTPKALANSQRMTPDGISALYCALDRETCLSEIRSITGDTVVSVALTPLAELKLLDLTKLERVEPPALTLLDEGYLNALHLKTFLASLVKKMSKPKGRNDNLAYLSTQVVFEHLRLRYGNQVDGLVFPSVQTGEKGTNIVLFPEVSALSLAPDPELGGVDKQAGLNSLQSDNPFGPQAKLAIVAGSIRFHKVTAIETTAKEYRHISDIFMSDLVRKRLGPRFE